MSVALVQSIPANSIYNKYIAFLEQYESKNTQKSYAQDIGHFFQLLCGKKIEQLQVNDITHVKEHPLSKSHIIHYRKFLVEKEYSESTINRKITAIKEFYVFLKSEHYNVDVEAFSINAFTANPEHYDVLSPEDVKRIAQEALFCTHGRELHAFIYLAASTSIRVSALLKSTMSMIKKYNDSCYILETIDKGKQKVWGSFEQFIYDKINVCKIDESDLLFPNLKPDYINKTIQKLAKKLKIEGYIVTHSLRKTAPTYEMDTSGDIRRGMQQTGHKNPQVFMDAYANRNKIDYTQTAGVRMFKPAQEEVFDDYSKEEILNALKSINPTAYHQLNQHLIHTLNKK